MLGDFGQVRAKFDSSGANTLGLGELGQFWRELGRYWANFFNSGAKSADLGGLGQCWHDLDRFRATFDTSIAKSTDGANFDNFGATSTNSGRTWPILARPRPNSVEIGELRGESNQF